MNRYGDAYDYLQENPGARLVHGLLGANQIETAWVEHGDVVYEPIRGSRYPTAFFAKHGLPKEQATYTAEEAATMLATHGHPGPWHEGQR